MFLTIRIKKTRFKNIVLNIIASCTRINLRSTIELRVSYKRKEKPIQTIKRLQEQRLPYKLTEIYQIALGLNVRWQIMSHFIAELIATFVTTRGSTAGRCFYYFHDKFLLL